MQNFQLRKRPQHKPDFSSAALIPAAKLSDRIRYLADRRLDVEAAARTGCILSAPSETGLDRSATGRLAEPFAVTACRSRLGAAPLLIDRSA